MKETIITVFDILFILCLFGSDAFIFGAGCCVFIKCIFNLFSICLSAKVYCVLFIITFIIELLTQIIKIIKRIIRLNELEGLVDDSKKR